MSALVVAAQEKPPQGSAKKRASLPAAWEGTTPKETSFSPAYEKPAVPAAAPTFTLPDAYRKQIAQLEHEGECQRRILLLAQGELPPVQTLAGHIRNAFTPRPLGSRALHLALLLRWLCRPEPPLAPYPVLQSLLELSYSGVSKIRRAALDYGLIRKTGQFRYLLTEKAIGLLETSPPAV
ncbi:MAG: hypothetical protein EOP50_15995 [Sphingobacteriales bacterium]|nr:MAG: hypothetical protein EOP50_15995 [Sphingobacteriales bacterium]